MEKVVFLEAHPATEFKFEGRVGMSSIVPKTISKNTKLPFFLGAIPTSSTDLKLVVGCGQDGFLKNIFFSRSKIRIFFSQKKIYGPIFFRGETQKMFFVTASEIVRTDFLRFY